MHHALATMPDNYTSGLAIMLTTPIAVEAKAGFRIWIEYDDGTEGVVDLEHLAGDGVFEAWEDRSLFEQVWITPHKSIMWGTESDELELCADALYLEISESGPSTCFGVAMYPI